jgi:hypothetical protein
VGENNCNMYLTKYPFSENISIIQLINDRQYNQKMAKNFNNHFATSI